MAWPRPGRINNKNNEFNTLAFSPVMARNLTQTVCNTAVITATKPPRGDEQ
jgi:hypothetical protein